MALETSSFTALNAQALELSLHDREIAALVDSGAQRSLITKAAVDRLGLKIKASESATLQGFDNKSPTSKVYKVAQIVMGKIGKRPIIMDALVINSLNDIHMSGACQFAKKVVKKVPIADNRLANQKSDNFTVDLLVAGDFRNKVVSMRRPPIQLYGMWLPSSVFGDYFLSGPIPGPAGVIRPEQKATNIITIGNVYNNMLQSFSDNKLLKLSKTVSYGKGSAFIKNELPNTEEVSKNVSYRKGSTFHNNLAE